MDLDVKSKLGDERLTATYERHLSRMQALFAGERLDTVFALRGVSESTERPTVDPQMWLENALAALSAQVDCAVDPVVFRPLVVNYNPYGVHFVDLLFGANVQYVESSNGWQVEMLSQPVGNLARPELSTNPDWQVAREIAKLFVAYDVPNVTFGLPTLSSALNIAVNLYGQDFLIATLTDPDAAHHDLRVINDVICDIHRWYLNHMPLDKMQCIVPSGRYQPPGYGQLCGCTTHLISASLYREFVAPLDAELLSVYSHGGMIHTCGVHTQHIPTWKDMDSLRAVQMNDRAAEDLELYFHELRNDQILYVNPCDAVPIEHILAVTGGHRTVIVADIHPSFDN